MMTVETAWQELLDKDDRTSPEAYPEMCLITKDELGAFIQDAFDIGFKAAGGQIFPIHTPTSETDVP